LIAAGQPVKVVSARLGHSNAAMTLNVYSHLWPDDEDRTRQAIDAVFSAKIDPGVPACAPLGRCDL
jgi:integrase